MRLLWIGIGICLGCFAAWLGFYVAFGTMEPPAYEYEHVKLDSTGGSVIVSAEEAKKWGHSWKPGIYLAPSDTLRSTWACEIILHDPATGLRIYRLQQNQHVLLASSAGGTQYYFQY